MLFIFEQVMKLKKKKIKIDGRVRRMYRILILKFILMTDGVCELAIS